VRSHPRFPTIGATLACALIATFADAPARAEASSWFAMSGGPSWLSRGDDSDLAPTMQIDLGVGSPPTYPAVVGGLMRTTTFFGHGTDLSLALRASTRGFSTGDWGAALDVGGFARWWGVSSSGPMGTLHFGMPFGLTLSAQAQLGSEDQRTIGAFLGVDLLRLTVYRLGGESLWANPRPAWRPGDP